MSDRLALMSCLALICIPSAAQCQSAPSGAEESDQIDPALDHPVPDYPFPAQSRIRLDPRSAKFVFHIPSSVENADQPGTSGVQAPADVNPFRVNPNQRPYWNIGVLSSSGGTCTAAYVGQNDVIMTAAHCVSDGQNTFSNFKFYQSAGGRNVKKTFRGTACLFFPSDWTGGRLHDYAFFKTADKSSAGWLGLGSSPVQNTMVTQVAYPSADEYSSGKKPWQYVAQIQYSPSYDNPGINSPFQKGSSGGPWIEKLTGDYVPNTNTAVSLTSGTNSLGVAGALFDQTTFDLYNRAAACSLPSS